MQRADRHLDVVLEVIAGQPLHLLRPRRAPHQRLTVGPNLRHNLAKLRLKPHVQHAVRLIEHEVRHATQRRLPHLHEINKTTGRRNHNLATALHVANLRSLRRAAVHARVPHARRDSERRRHFLNLHRQLARRRKDKSNRAVAALELRLCLDVDQGWQDVRERLARARLRNADHVAPAERHRPPLRLDRRRLLKALFPNSIHDVLGERRLLKRADGLRHVLADNRHLIRLAEGLHLGGRHLRNVRVLRVEVLLKSGQREHVKRRVGIVLVVEVVRKVRARGARPLPALLLTKPKATTPLAAGVPTSLAVIAQLRRPVHS
eukprot:Opistho-1_new@71114